MTEVRHEYTVGGEKKACKVCAKLFPQCMHWVSLWIIEGINSRDIESLGKRAQFITDFPPHQVFSYMKDLDQDIGIVDIQNTKFNSFLLTTKGQIYSWGINNVYACNPCDSRLPFCPPGPIRDLSQVTIVSISCGEEHVLALESGMYLWSWGINSRGQLGRNAEEEAGPAPIQNINQIVRIAAGPYTSYAVQLNGNVYAWGDNRKNELSELFDRADENEIVSKPTELLKMPWKRNNSTVQRSYFKTENIRELDIAGVSRAEIKRRQAENDDLKRRIESLRKKVDTLEDEMSGVGSKRISSKWDTDIHLKEIRMLRDRASKANKKVWTSIEKLKTIITNSEKEIKSLQKQIENLDKEIIETWNLTKEHETLINNKKADLEGALETNQKDMANKYETELVNLRVKRKEYHANATHKEIEKSRCGETIKKLEIEIEASKEKIVRKEGKIDKNLEIYNQMEAVRKKAIAEETFSLNESTFQKEIEQLVVYEEALKKSDPDYISKKIGKYATPLEILKVSDYILNVFDKEINELFKAKFGSAELVNRALMVIADNVRLRKQVNNFSKLISGPINEKIEKQKMAELKKRVPPVMWKHVKDKEKFIKDIFREADFSAKKYGFDDPFTKRLYRYQEKQKEAKPIEKREKRWRLC
ncbi:unnamed protein product [Blepharisma stoltei]|uniref:Uncharacterized protein n=1 Tax=Blepharisma stoltei TaxID=1481888 RepID=A0AAU9J3D7_9CILI|nr:unnamed protein product [Blepharisma stoltei]